MGFSVDLPASRTLLPAVVAHGDASLWVQRQGVHRQKPLNLEGRRGCLLGGGPIRSVDRNASIRPPSSCTIRGQVGRGIP